MTEAEYRKHPALNFSKLSELDQSPKIYIWKRKNPDEFEGDKSYFNIGAGLDTLITGSEAEFKSSFSVGTVPAPTDMMRSFCDFYVHSILKGSSEKLAIDFAYSNSGFKTQKKTVEKNFGAALPQTYVKEKLEAHPKKYLTKDEGELVLKMNKLLDKNEKAVYYLKKKLKKVDRKFQFPIIFNVRGKETKALLDLLFIDHNAKTIEPIDLKTTSKNITEFGQSFIKYRYYLQAAFYTEAVRQWVLNQTMLKAVGGFDYSDYKILPFKFIVVDKSGYNIPMIYESTEKDLYSGTHGGQLKNGEFVRGYIQLIDDLTWHESNNYWDAPRAIVESAFTKTLDVFQ